MVKRAPNLLSILMMAFLWFVPCYGEMYQWVDEKGTLHFADDLTKVPEKYRSAAEQRKISREKSESPPSTYFEKPKPFPEKPSPLKPFEAEGYEVPLIRRHELWLAEVVLNGRAKEYFIVDTGASFTLISHQIAKELGIRIDETTPFIRVASVSNVMLTPLITLKSVRVGKAEVEQVEAVVYDMPSYPGLLGNSFLNKFKVVLDSLNGKMTLFSLQGIPSPERPGGYTKEYWVGQFRFYHRNLEDLKGLKAAYEQRGLRTELKRINHAIRYFEEQLNELERRASFAGVPRNWRE